MIYIVIVVFISKLNNIIEICNSPLEPMNVIFLFKLSVSLGDVTDLHSKEGVRIFAILLTRTSSIQ